MSQTFDLSSDEGLKALEAHLAQYSFVSGYSPSSLDVEVSKVLSAHDNLPNVSRFVRYMTSLTKSELNRLNKTQPGSDAPKVKSSGSASSAKSSKSSSSSSSSVESLYNPYSGQAIIKKIFDGGEGVAYVGQKLTVGGWVKTGRDQKHFAFIMLNDGSTPKNLQVVVTPDVYQDISSLILTGTSLLIEGVVQKTPEDVKDAKQLVELQATKILFVGLCPGTYPISKTKLPTDFLRTVPHLRPRTNLISSVARIRNALAFATHSFFQEHGFAYVHTPLLTASDCEGAGEMFAVTTMFKSAEEEARRPPVTDKELAAAQAEFDTRAQKVQDLTAKGAKTNQIEAATKDMNEKKRALDHLISRRNCVNGFPYKDGKLDFSEDFFGKESYLTVSGQLHVETYACAINSVYTFGPTFRAEDSHTARHLAEFWMIEPELAFCDLDGMMKCVQDYVQYMCQFLLDNCYDDLEFMNERIDNKCIERVRQVVAQPFKRISYTEAIELLLKEMKDKKVKFDNPVEWGVDLKSEHEKYICEVVFKQPVFVYNYPKAIKAFYMRANEDGKTVASMDLLVPGVGELVGGSQREERAEVLEKIMIDKNLPLDTYYWYLDLRRFGTVPHSGFGLGFERMILFSTGIENIRETIPFPRWPGHCVL